MLRRMVTKQSCPIFVGRQPSDIGKTVKTPSASAAAKMCQQFQNDVYCRRFARWRHEQL